MREVVVTFCIGRFVLRLANGMLTPSKGVCYKVCYRVAMGSKGSKGLMKQWTN